RSRRRLIAPWWSPLLYQGRRVFHPPAAVFPRQAPSADDRVCMEREEPSASPRPTPDSADHRCTDRAPPARQGPVPAPPRIFQLRGRKPYYSSLVLRRVTREVPPSARRGTCSRRCCLYAIDI